MGDLATARILKEILDELKKMNQKLDLTRDERGVDADVKNENQHDEAIETRLEAEVESLSARTADNDMKDDQGANLLGATASIAAIQPSALVDGLVSEMPGEHVLATQGAIRDAEVSQPVMSGGLGDTGHRGNEGDGSDDGQVRSPRNSQSLVERTSNDGVSSELETSTEYAGEEVTFEYQWNEPSHDIPHPNTYPPPSQLIKDRWSEILPFWGIPIDQRVMLTLNTPNLYFLPQDEADGVLKAVRDYSKDLKSKGSAYSQFTIDDYLAPDGRLRRYFDNAWPGNRFDQPNEEMRVRFDTGNYPPLDETEAPPAPWRRFM